MNNGLKLIVALVLGAAALQGTARAEDKAPAAFKDDKEKASYSIGMMFGNQIKRAGFDLDLDTVFATMKDAVAGKELKLNDQQARETIMAYQKEATQKLADKNRKLGESWLEANKKKDGVKTHTVTLADGKTAEMQYKVITEGTGVIPKSNDVVSVNYRGTLIDGKEFDNSSKRGQPAKFPVTRVVRGWTEALQMMKVGSKWELYLPASLAYGDRAAGPTIEPGSTLVFEMELLGIEAPQPPPSTAAAQPLTSDIIKVPSAEELKKGAKIEVIKPEDVEKRAQEEKKAQEAQKK